MDNYKVEVSNNIEETSTKEAIKKFLHFNIFLL